MKTDGKLMQELERLGTEISPGDSIVNEVMQRVSQEPTPARGRIPVLWVTTTVCAGLAFLTIAYFGWIARGKPYPADGKLVVGTRQAKTVQEATSNHSPVAANDAKRSLVSSSMFVAEPSPDAVKPTKAAMFAFSSLDPVIHSVFQNSKWGVIDATGRVIVEPRFSRVLNLAEGRMAVKDGGTYRRGGKWGFLDNAGALVIKPQFHGARSFSEGLAAVAVGDKCGYINQRGELVIPPRFDWRPIGAADFHEGLAVIQVGGPKGKFGGKFGYIDKKGKIVVTPRFDNAGWFSEGVAGVGLVSDTSTGSDSSTGTTQCGYIDKTGKVVIELKYEAVGEFREGLGSVKLNGEWIFVDKRGKPASDEKVKGKGHYVDPKGRLIFEPFVAEKYPQGKARFSVGQRRSENRWGFKDVSGNIVIPPQFEWTENFVNGVARFASNVNWKPLEEFEKKHLSGDRIDPSAISGRLD